MEEDYSIWDEYDSGPFCIHWGDPVDCDHVCACGHKCHEHCGSCDRCECLGFTEPLTPSL